MLVLRAWELASLHFEKKNVTILITKQAACDRCGLHGNTRTMAGGHNFGRVQKQYGWPCISTKPCSCGSWKYTKILNKTLELFFLGGKKLNCLHEKLRSQMSSLKFYSKYMNCGLVPVRVSIWEKSARTYTWENGQNVRWSWQPIAPHDNRSRKYTIAKIDWNKICLENIPSQSLRIICI